MTATLTTARPDARRETLGSATMARRDQIAFVVFSSWTIAGLYLDGWAHGAEKPESFFTPWHGLLYSGFLAAMAWTIFDVRRRTRRGEPVDTDKLAPLGGVLFLASGVGDMVWHTIFGVEEDFAALLSPTHLLLMVAGLLLTTAPLRTNWRDATAGGGGLATQLAALALSAALLSFFLMFANPLLRFDGPTTGDAYAVLTAAGVLVTNAVLVGPLVWLASRAQLPRGAVFGYLTIVIALTLGLDGFHRWPLISLAVAGGVAGQATRRVADRGLAGLAIFGASIAGAIWTTYFLVTAAVESWTLEVELWTGPIVLAIIASIGLAHLAGRPAGVNYDVMP